MTSPGERTTLTRDDVTAAQTVIDAWTSENTPWRPGTRWDQQLGALRGLMAAAMSDVRYAGYLEGLQRGRQSISAVVRDALEGEGL